MRVSRRMTQTALATATGLNRTSIVNIEHGKQRILLHTLYEIAAALDVPTVDLLASAAESASVPDLDLDIHGPDVQEFVKSVISTLKPKAPDG